MSPAETALWLAAGFVAPGVAITAYREVAAALRSFRETSRAGARSTRLASKEFRGRPYARRRSAADA